MPKLTSTKSRAALKSLEEGIKLREEGRLKEAIEAFTNSIEINPDDYIPFYNLGICKQKLGKHKEAITYFDLAVTLKPKESAVFIGRAESKLETKNFSGAIEDYTEYLYLAEEKLDQGKAKEAFHDFTLLIETNRSYDEEAESKYLIKEDSSIFLKAHIGRGKAKKEMGDLIGAILDWSYAAELGNKEAGQLCRKEYLEKNYEVNTNDLKEIEEQAQDYLKSKLNNKAITQFTKVLEYKRILNGYISSSSWVYLLSGEAKEAAGDQLGALLDWSLAAELGNKSASDILKKKRRKETETHNHLKDLSTSERLILLEDPKEYKKWIESNYTYKVTKS